MPIPSQIPVAAYAFSQNDALLSKSIDGLTPRSGSSARRRDLEPAVVDCGPPGLGAFNGSEVPWHKVGAAMAAFLCARSEDAGGV